MKTFQIILLVFLLSINSFSQSKKFSFTLGSEYELPRNTEDLAFIGNNKDGIVNLGLKKDELSVIRFNPSTLKKEFEQRIDLDASRNMNSEIVVNFNNTNYFWLHSDCDWKSGIEILYCDKIDILNGKMISANNKLFESKKLVGTNTQSILTGIKTINKYKFHYDTDEKKLLVTYKLVPEEKNKKNKLRHYRLPGF